MVFTCMGSKLGEADLERQSKTPWRQILFSDLEDENFKGKFDETYLKTINM